MSKELPKYKCHKEVWALKIKEVKTDPGVIVPEDESYEPIPVGESYIEKHKPEAGGYLVAYADGYESYSPAKAFEEGYTPIGEDDDGCKPPTEGLSFGDALWHLKRRKKIARKGWNGKGMFLWLKPAAEVKAGWCKDPMLKQLAEENGGEILALGTICMYTHDSTGRKATLTGWLASQSDMLLEDWEIVG